MVRQLKTVKKIGKLVKKSKKGEKFGKQMVKNLKINGEK